MNKKSKEIVKKLCFTLVIVISIITIIGCPNTVSNKTNSESTEQNKPNPPTPPLPTDPDDWSGLTPDQVIQKMRITDEVIYSLRGLGFGKKNNDGKFYCLLSSGPADNDELKAKCTEYTKPYCFPSDSVKLGLEARWDKAQKTFEMGFDWIPYYENSHSLNAADKPVGLYHLRKIFFASQCGFIVNENKTTTKLPTIYIVLEPTSIRYVIDWEIVFIPNGKSGSPPGLESYSFHFGPYIVSSDKDSDLNPIPPFIPPGKPFYDRFHKFELKDMLGVCLTNKKADVGVDLLNFPPFIESEYYDTYIVFADFGGTGKMDSGRPSFAFRNVVKLNLSPSDDFWDKCWKP